MAKQNTLVTNDDLWHVPTSKGRFLQMGNVKWEETMCGIFIRMNMRNNRSPMCQDCIDVARKSWGVQIIGHTRRPGTRQQAQTRSVYVPVTVPLRCVPPEPKPEPKPEPIHERVMKVEV